MKIRQIEWIDERQCRDNTVFTAIVPIPSYLYKADVAGHDDQWRWKIEKIGSRLIIAEGLANSEKSAKRAIQQAWEKELSDLFERV